MDSIRTVVGEDTVISTVVLVESRKKALASNPNSNHSIHNFPSTRECYGKLVEVINAGDTSELKLQSSVKDWVGLVSDVLTVANSIALMIESGMYYRPAGSLSPCQDQSNGQKVLRLWWKMTARCFIRCWAQLCYCWTLSTAPLTASNRWWSRCGRASSSLSEDTLE